MEYSRTLVAFNERGVILDDIKRYESLLEDKNSPHRARYGVALGRLLNEYGVLAGFTEEKIGQTVDKANEKFFPEQV